jgi:hypothetical protein
LNYPEIPLIDHRRMLLDLLAVIHQDGGHFVEERGLPEAYTAAMEKIPRLLHRTPEPVSAPWPFPTYSSKHIDTDSMDKVSHEIALELSKSPPK